MKRVCSLLVVILLPIAIVLSVFQYYVFNTGVHSEILKEVSSMDEEARNELLSEVIGYLKGSRDALAPAHFNERERMHMQDVKSLLAKVRMIWVVALLLLLVSLLLARKKRLMAAALFRGSLLSLVLILFVIVAASVRFERLFFLFHTLAFKNNLWLLAPKDTLIVLFPEAFFQKVFIRILAATSMLSFFMLIATRIYVAKQTKA